MDCGSTILIFLAFIQATCGQSVTLTGPLNGAKENGSDTVYTCTGGTDPYTFTWTELSVGPSGVTIFIGEEEAYDPLVSPKYVNFGVEQNGDTSTMTITNTLIEDEGQYGCVELPAGTGKNADAELTVEVNGTLSISPNSPIKSNINDMFVATCEALEGRPNVTLTWMLDDGPSPCDDTVVTYPEAAEGLSSTRSVCTFQATSDNNGQPLKCVITGHLVPGLNGEVTATLDTHTSPSAEGTTVTVAYVTQGAGITVSCTAQNPPTPAMRNYYIFSNGTLIHDSMDGSNTVFVSDPEEGTQYTCMAGNYLGNTSLSEGEIYDPNRTTTPSPTTEPITTEGITTTPPALETTTKNEKTIGSGGRTGPAGLSGGAYAGIAIGVIACIVIIVVIVLFLLKPECCPCFASGIKSSGSSKPAGSAVGSSNGSEREKLPQAAPRGHGSIQHTNDNPDQAMYAMVDKKPARGGGGAGDAPDRGSAPGQNEPQGMLYADLDLSHKAGHTDKHVPKNENDVVVYSSILV